MKNNRDRVILVRSAKVECRDCHEIVRQGSKAYWNIDSKLFLHKDCTNTLEEIDPTVTAVINFVSKYNSKCKFCPKVVKEGKTIWWNIDTKKVACKKCRHKL